jgi:hypothetical protein
MKIFLGKMKNSAVSIVAGHVYRARVCSVNVDQQVASNNGKADVFFTLQLADQSTRFDEMTRDFLGFFLLNKKNCSNF